MVLPLYDPEPVLRIHETTLDFAIQVQKDIAEQLEGSTTRLVAGAALQMLAHEAICLHRAIKDLCVAGWAFAAPVLLRALLESMLSTVVIVNSDHSDLTAFEYFHAYTKGNLNDLAADPGPVAAEARANIDKHMEQMAAEDQMLAQEYLKTPMAGYFWYSDRFKGPTAIIKAYSPPEVLDLYGVLSVAAHAGFYGLLMFRDDPNLLNVNPRKDARATGFAIVSSSRLLAETTGARLLFAGLSLKACDDIVRMIQAVRPIG